MQRMKTPLLVLVFTCLSMMLKAQSVVPMADEDTIRINNLLLQAEKLYQAEPDSAYALAFQAKQLSVAKAYKKGEANGLSTWD
jgi:hypothetical protein